MWRPPQLGCAGLAASRRCSLVVSASRHHAVVQQRAAPQLPDPYLFASIKGCGSLDQCASLLDTHADRLSAMLICTLAIQTVQLCGRQPQAQLGPYSSDGGHGRDSSSSSSSSSSSRQRDSQGLEQEQRQRYCTRLARLSTKRLGEFRPQQMSSLLWAFARLGYVPPPTWTSRFLGAVERALVDFPPGRLSQLIWALARLGITPPSSFLNSFLAESLDKLHSSSPRDLSNTLWALAQMRVVVPPDYLTTAMAAAQQQWTVFQVHELCVFAWGLAKQPASIGAVTRQWVGDLVTQAGVLVPQGSGREAGMLLWALARWKGVVDPWQLDQVVCPTLQVLVREVAATETLATGHVPAQQQVWSSNSRIHHPQQQQQQQQKEQQEQAAGSSSFQGMSPGSTLQQPAWQPQSLASASYYSQLQQAQGAHQAAAAAEGTCHAAAVALSSLATLAWRPRVHQEQQQALLLEVVSRLAHHAQQLRHVATLWWAVAALGLRPPPQMVAVLEQQSLQFMQQQQQQQQRQQQERSTAYSSAAAAGPLAANTTSSSSSSVIALGDILQLLLACARLKWRPSDMWWQTCYTFLLSGHASGGHDQHKLRRPLLLAARADQLAQLVSCIAAVKGPPPPPQVWQRLFERYEQVTQNISYWRRSGALTAAAAAAGSSAGSSVTDTLVGHQLTAGGLEQGQEQEEEAEAAAAISQMSMEQAEFVLAVAGHMQQQEQEQQAGRAAAMGAATATPRAGQTAGVTPQHSRTSSLHTPSQQQEVSTGGLPGKSIVWLLWACAKHGVVPPSRLMVALLQQLLRKLPELGMAPCAALAWALRQLCCLGLRQKVPCTRLLCVVVLGVALRGKRLVRTMLSPSSSGSSSSSRHGARAMPAEAQRLQKQLLALVAVGGLRRPLQQLLERRKRHMALNRHRLRRGLPPLTGAQLQKGLLLAW